MSHEEDLFQAALGPENGTVYRLSRAVGARFPGQAVVEGLESTFDVEHYASGGNCVLRPRATPHARRSSSWTRKHGLHHGFDDVVFDVEWRGHTLVVVRAEWPAGYSKDRRHWVVATSRDVADEFAAAVSAWCNHPREAVLVFRGGCWTPESELWREIQRASFDDLVLAGDLAASIREDFAAFLEARDEYARYGVPWKRGVLFVGPPGNGKTHCLRASINMLGVPCLYVQSLKSRYETEDANIARVFDRAREVSPCCLVFEDLDAMITSENRSVFLNQLDGFANASGLLVLATTNHPERLDPAILDRPSRFDRKYAFALPGPKERARYVARWNERLDAAMRVADEDLEQLVAETEDFSFAYLKELFLSAMIRWMRAREPGTMPALLRAQLATLREQMKTDPTPTPEVPPAREPSPFE